MCLGKRRHNQVRHNNAPAHHALTQGELLIEHFGSASASSGFPIYGMWKCVLCVVLCVVCCVVYCKVYRIWDGLEEYFGRNSLK